MTEMPAAKAESMPRPRWDIFCAVVDNFGDIGVCWRLAQQLAAEQNREVRLWVDHLESFSQLCPNISPEADQQQCGPIDVRHWPRHSPDAFPDAFPDAEVADVVIEAFGCELPARYLASMAQREVTPVWINLEYLSAERWVEDCHLLMSPAPRSRLSRHFFFPGFTTKTGGVLQERDLNRSRQAFTPAEATQFLTRIGISTPNPDGLLISLFCYENPALPPLLECWANGTVPVTVLVTPGFPSTQVSNWFQQELIPGQPLQHGKLTVCGLPFLSQPDYDRLLWSCDLNFVRGEDSFVRAQWARKPFVWQIYPQSENTHLFKLDAFLGQFLRDFPQSAAVERFWQAWNGVGEISLAWQDFREIRNSLQEHTEVWACQLDRTGNLADNLVRFVRGKS